MAKAIIETIPPVPVEPERVVHLDLNMEEASALRALLGRGNAVGITNNIYIALRDAGVTNNDWYVTDNYGGYIATYIVKKGGKNE